jgi:hypothetical protein
VTLRSKLIIIVYVKGTTTFVSRCPVCNRNLGDLGDATSQEYHVKSCLEGSSGSAPQSARYLVYKLPGESSLIGVECALIYDPDCSQYELTLMCLGVICLDEFVKGIVCIAQAVRLSLSQVW